MRAPASLDGREEKLESGKGKLEIQRPHSLEAHGAAPMRAPFFTSDFQISTFDSPYSVMMRSAHSTIGTKIAGLPNLAFQVARSVSETPRARAQAPQAKTGIL